MTFLIAFLIFLLSLIVLIIISFIKICEWNFFIKANKEGWEAVIPIYGTWTFLEICGYPGWITLLFILVLTPIAGINVLIGLIIIRFLACNSLAKKFHKSKKFGIMLALLPIVGYPILAFSNDKYDNSLGKKLNYKK